MKTVVIASVSVLVAAIAVAVLQTGRIRATDESPSQPPQPGVPPHCEAELAQVARFWHPLGSTSAQWQRRESPMLAWADSVARGGSDAALRCLRGVVAASEPAELTWETLVATCVPEAARCVPVLAARDGRGGSDPLARDLAAAAALASRLRRVSHRRAAALAGDSVGGVEVLVVGAGPVGLASAIVAHTAGGSVVVVEQRSECSAASVASSLTPLTHRYVDSKLATRCPL